MDTEQQRELQPGETATIELDQIPPSVNQIWRHRIMGKHTITYKSAEGKEFNNTMGEAIPKWILPTDKQVMIEVDLYFPTHRRADVDNYMKAILDGMNKRIYNDDTQVTTLIINKYYAKSLPATKIQVSIHPTQQ